MKKIVREKVIKRNTYTIDVNGSKKTLNERDYLKYCKQNNIINPKEPDRIKIKVLDDKYNLTTNNPSEYSSIIAKKSEDGKTALFCGRRSIKCERR